MKNRYTTIRNRIRQLIESTPIWMTLAIFSVSVLVSFYTSVVLENDYFYLFVFQYEPLWKHTLFTSAGALVSLICGLLIFLSLLGRVKHWHVFFHATLLVSIIWSALCVRDLIFHRRAETYEPRKLTEWQQSRPDELRESILRYRQAVAKRRHGSP